MSTEMVFRLDISQIRAGLFGLTKRMQEAVVQYHNSLKLPIKLWMQMNAPWTDRTGDARRTLETEVEQTPELIRIIMYYQVYYGQYLESMQAGRFNILRRTIAHYQQKYVAGLRRIFS